MHSTFIGLFFYYCGSGTSLESMGNCMTVGSERTA